MEVSQYLCIWTCWISKGNPVEGDIRSAGHVWVSQSSLNRLLGVNDVKERAGRADGLADNDYRRCDASQNSDH